jgi:hypothetical protein
MYKQSLPDYTVEDIKTMTLDNAQQVLNQERAKEDEHGAAWRTTPAFKGLDQTKGLKTEVLAAVVDRIRRLKTGSERGGRRRKSRRTRRRQTRRHR